MSKRVFVCVSGGVVHEVIVPPETNGTWTVIDWDNIESDPAREWDQFDLTGIRLGYLSQNFDIPLSHVISLHVTHAMAKKSCILIVDLRV